MSTMTSRERVLAAMALQTPDRVPVMCQMSIGHMLQQLDVSGAEFWFNAGTFAQGLLELRDIYDFDGILVSLHGHIRDWREKAVKFETVEKVDILTFDGYTMTFVRDDLPEVDYVEEPEQPGIDDVDPQDIPDVINYIPVSGGLHFDLDMDNKFEIFSLLAGEAGRKYSLHGEVTSPFDYLLDYLGYENALMAMIEDPAKCKAVLQRFTDGVVALTREMCEQDIDAIKISSPFAGMGFISPAFYREFVLPYERQFIAAAKERGKYIYIHTCGAIDDRLEAMRESGASGLACLDPPPLGNVNLDDAIARIGQDMFIKGNVDSVNTLLQGTEDDIRADVRARIELGKQAGGFILSTACSIAPHVSRGRVRLLGELANQYGQYN